MRRTVSAGIACIGIATVALWSTVPSSAQVEAKLNLHRGKAVPGHCIVVLRDGADASSPRIGTYDATIIHQGMQA